MCKYELSMSGLSKFIVRQRDRSHRNYKPRLFAGGQYIYITTISSNCYCCNKACDLSYGHSAGSTHLLCEHTLANILTN